MNHAIMAAGHPRLTFEFAAYLAAMPRHWLEKEKGPVMALRVWAAGQVAAAIRALELLERSEEHTSELQSLMRITYAGLCSTKKNITTTISHLRQNKHQPT